MKKNKVLDNIITLQSIYSKRLALVEPEYKSIEGLTNGLVGTIFEISKRAENSQYLVGFPEI